MRKDSCLFAQHSDTLSLGQSRSLAFHSCCLRSFDAVLLLVRFVRGAGRLQSHWQPGLFNWKLLGSGLEVAWKWLRSQFEVTWIQLEVPWKSLRSDFPSPVSKVCKGSRFTTQLFVFRLFGFECLGSVFELLARSHSLSFWQFCNLSTSQPSQFLSLYKCARSLEQF